MTPLCKMRGWEKLFQEHGVNWNDYPVPQKRGVCVYREVYETSLAPEILARIPEHKRVSLPEKVTRARWVVDENIPIFTTPEGRAYVSQKMLSGSQEISRT